MAAKKKRPPPPRNDAELKKRLRDMAPEVLIVEAPDNWFGTITDRLLQKSPDAQNPHFYCRPCGEYHLKTHPHRRAK